MKLFDTIKVIIV